MSEINYFDEANVIKGGFVEFKTLDDYKENKDVYMIYASEIDDEERLGEVPEEGYVWK